MGLNICDRCVSDCRHERNPNEIVVKCGAFKAPQTNADRIQSMTDEELAREINLLLEGEISIPYCRDLPECDADVERDALIPLERCEQCVLHWLRQPAEEVPK